MSTRAVLIGLAVGAGVLIVMMPGAAVAAVLDESGGGDAGGEWWGGETFGGIGEQLETVFDSVLGAGPSAEELSAVSDGDNVSAFLMMIRTAEGTAGPLGYQTMFGGETFTDFSDHPRRAITRNLGGKPITSTAAGAYQFLSRTWDGCKTALGLPDFSPASQDAAAVYLIKGRGALGDVQAGRFADAVRKCNREWASLPGSPYGQPTISLDRAYALFTSFGGTVTA